MTAIALDSWKAAAPYSEGQTFKYDVTADIDMGGNPLGVEIVLYHKTTKKTETGFEGESGFEEIFVNGEEMDGFTMQVTLDPNGALKSVKAEEGDGMRRMFMPYYFCYPSTGVDDGGTWGFQDTVATDGHKAKFEYTLVGSEDMDGAKCKKVKVAISEEGPNPMKADGHYWVSDKGQVAKFEISVTGWPVPVAGQAFDAKIKGKIKS